jgi:hypothetical protein
MLLGPGRKGGRRQLSRIVSGVESIMARTVILCWQMAEPIRPDGRGDSGSVSCKSNNEEKRKEKKGQSESIIPLCGPGEVNVSPLDLASNSGRLSSSHLDRQGIRIRWGERDLKVTSVLTFFPQHRWLDPGPPFTIAHGEGHGQADHVKK